MASLKELEIRIKRLEARNKRVEAGKSWELSWTRRIIIATFTYLAIGIYLYTIEVSNPWLNAIIPSFAFLLSTLSMPALKDIWMKRRK